MSHPIAENPSETGISRPALSVKRCPSSIPTSGTATIEERRPKDTANKADLADALASLLGEIGPICSISPRAPRLLSVTESVALPPQPSRRSDGKYSKDQKRERTSRYVCWVKDGAGCRALCFYQSRRRGASHAMGRMGRAPRLDRPPSRTRNP